MPENRDFYKRQDLGATFNRPAILNPLTAIRENLGLTVDQVAQDLSMHRNSILRTEQGQYASPPEDLLEYYGLHTHQRESILERYNHWRVLMRKANYGLLDQSILMQYNFSCDIGHPFKQWRLASGVKALNTVAKAFALHQGILFRYESQSHLCNFTPLVIIDALIDSGYTAAETAYLEDLFQWYKECLRDSLTTTHSSSVERAS